MILYPHLLMSRHATGLELGYFADFMSSAHESHSVAHSGLLDLSDPGLPHHSHTASDAVRYLSVIPCNMASSSSVTSPALGRA